jgi:hypothetical protein
MSFVVEVERRFRVQQGLPSPIRARSGQPRIESGVGVELTPS